MSNENKTTVEPPSDAAVRSSDGLDGGGRVCPHCHGSLERYEDPKAVEIIGKLEAELRQETMRVDWLLARQYNHKTRESVDTEIFACGDCDPCLGGRPDQCAVMAKPPNDESSYRSGPVAASNNPAAQSAHSD